MSLLGFFQSKPKASILISGLAKSGTTALMFKIRNSSPYRSIKTLSEPLTYQAADGAGHECVLAKIIVWMGLPLFELGARDHQDPVHYRDFDVFEKKIHLVRDPRDRLLSHILYSAKKSSFSRDPQGRERFVALLRKKEQDPGSVSVTDLLEAGARAKGVEWVPQRWKKAYEVYLACGLRYAQEERGLHLLKYEDFIEGKMDATERYLGFALKGRADMDPGFERVVRAKSKGDWRHWFLESDIDLFKPLFRDLIDRYGYDADWTLDPAPRIEPDHASGYVERSILGE